MKKEPVIPAKAGIHPVNTEAVHIVCGTTSSGKSSYAFQLAKEYKKEVNILSVDSRQFYKDIPIISGQDKKEDLPTNVTLFGQGFLKSTESSNIAEFQSYAKKIITDSQIQNKKLIIVGGSGLYLKAITQKLKNTTVPPDEVFRKQAEKMTVTELQNNLKNLNEELFNSLNNSDANNPRRIIRHIEITTHTATQSVIPAKAGIHQIITTSVVPDSDPESSTRHSRAGGNPSSNSYIWIGLRKNPDHLLQSIKERVTSRLKNGAVDEVQALLKKQPNTALPIYSSLGVKEILKYINKEISQEQLIEQWTIADNNYAKRQNVWFKKQPNIVWYDISI